MSVIVLKNKGAIIPTELLTKVTADCTSSIGVARAVNGKLQRRSELVAADATVVDAVQQKFKDSNVLFHFGKYPSGLNLEDLQPLVLLKNEDDPLVLAFLEGDFTPYRQEGTSHTAAFNAFNKTLRPMAEKLFKQQNGDLDKFLEELRDPLYKQMIENMSVSRLHVSLLAANGEILSYAKPGPATFDWGWTTALSSSVEKAEEPPVQEEPKEDNLDDVDFGTPKKVETPVVSAPVQTKSKIKDNVLHLPEKSTTTSVPVVKEVEYKIVTMSPPKEVQGHNALKKWYRGHNNNGGALPHNWKERPAIEARIKIKHKEAPIKDFSELKSKIKEAPVEVKVVAEDTKTTVTVTEQDKTETKVVEHKKSKIKMDAPEPVVQPDTPKPVEPEVPQAIPFIPPEQADALINDMTDGKLSKMVIDLSNQKISAPETMKAMEAKWITFWEKTATHFEESAAWTPEWFIHMSKHYPEALAVLAMNFRTIAFINASEVKKLSLKIEKLLTAAQAPQQPKSKIKAA
jgi:hypothetical protein